MHANIASRRGPDSRLKRNTRLVIGPRGQNHNQRDSADQYRRPV
jgi:hypothetical protein